MSQPNEEHKPSNFLRAVIERATLEMITRIYRAPGACAIPLGTAADPLRDAGEQPYYAPVAYAPQPYQQPYGPAPYQPAPYPAYAPVYGEGGRNQPYRSYVSNDGGPGLLGLRGGL